MAGALDEDSYRSGDETTRTRVQTSETRYIFAPMLEGSDHAPDGAQPIEPFSSLSGGGCLAKSPPLRLQRVPPTAETCDEWFTHVGFRRTGAARSRLCRGAFRHFCPAFRFLQPRRPATSGPRLSASEELGQHGPGFAGGHFGISAQCSGRAIHIMGDGE
ncbi:unnamed protein product [Polarella glacialis]|uniref:Uncharacterized protein n=1 Tax=Polarella glacialis TaxID=89957 RepID=A0A813FXF6_POLGL|nr:unnamed protein product [Polarella glacialis]